MQFFNTLTKLSQDTEWKWQLTLWYRLYRESGTSEERHVSQRASIPSMLLVQLLELRQRHKAVQGSLILHVHHVPFGIVHFACTADRTKHQSYATCDCPFCWYYKQGNHTPFGIVHFACTADKVTEQNTSYVPHVTVHFAGTINTEKSYTIWDCPLCLYCRQQAKSSCAMCDCPICWYYKQRGKLYTTWACPFRLYYKQQKFTPLGVVCFTNSNIRRQRWELP